jgi:hypothetical protein
MNTGNSGNIQIWNPANNFSCPVREPVQSYCLFWQLLYKLTTSLDYLSVGMFLIYLTLQIFPYS